MKNKLFYTESILISFRIISILCSSLLLLSVLLSVRDGRFLGLVNDRIVNYSDFFGTLINIVIMFLFVFTIFFPHKMGFCALVAFLYSISIIPFEPENYMGILMFFLGTAVLFARGLMKKRTKLKLFLLLVLFVLLLLTHLRFGIVSFVKYFLINSGCILVIALYTFFLRSYYLDNIFLEDKKLNIAMYHGLDERDCRILQSIQKGEKYFAIAKDLNISLGHLKNRMHFIFTTLQCGDRQGFMSFYDDWELFYEPKNK